MGKAQQCITGLAASFGAVLMGTLNTWPSYTLELLKSPETTVMSTPMTDFEASLVSSLPSLGAMAGTAVTGVVISRLGRKRGAMVLVLPFLLSWLIVLEFSSSSIPIMVARFIGGVGGGSTFVYAPIFISEISESSIRGALSSGTVALYCFGCILSYLAGWFLSYKMIIWLNLSLGVLNLFLFTFVVESPLFLLMKNNEYEAIKALAHYRDGSVTSKTVLEELSVMKQQLNPAVELLSVNSDLEKKEEEAEKLTQSVVLPKPRKQSAIRKLFTDRASRRAFLIVGTPLALQVWMGMAAVQVYAGDLFTRAAPNLSSDFCAVLLAVTLFAGSAVAAVVADRAGRRILIISSSAMVTFFMITLGAQIKYSFLPAWMTAAIVLVYCFCFIFGAGTVPYVLLAEVFTPEVQGIASMILVECVWLQNFLIIAVFPLMVSMLGTHGSFYAFGCVGAVNMALSYFCLPETKGMSNKQIQEIFSK